MDVTSDKIMGSGLDMEQWSIWKTRIILGDQVRYEYMLAISLYRVIWRVRVMTLHLGVVNGGTGMGHRTWDCFHDVSVMISCPGDSGVGICTWLCVYAFGSVQIAVYDMGDVICVW